jgi:hypothetical protein
MQLARIAKLRGQISPHRQVDGRKLSKAALRLILRTISDLRRAERRDDADGTKSGDHRARCRRWFELRGQKRTDSISLKSAIWGS